MNKYLETFNNEVREYFKILSPEFPGWLIDYIDTPEMHRLDGISMFCSTDYQKMYSYKSSNSVFQHSIGVALIIWHFTNDKKQTLAGLFHDIASPTFKHCIDFMNGDSEHQESTEERTELIIRNSNKIMSLLKRDNIKVEEICDYHIYPIADNDTPKLSADRFEYTFSNGLFLYDVWTLQEIEHFYNNIIILKNEDGIDELGFEDVKICEEYVYKILPIFANYHSDQTVAVMQCIADIIKSMNVKGYISIDDLYKLSEKDVINKILHCNDEYIRNIFIKWQNATSVYGSDTPIKDKYCTSVKGKVRYIIPLAKFDKKSYRINEISQVAAKYIEEYLNIKHYKYKGFDFNFKPYDR